ncbi:MAG: heavy metal translocating P-type ATPase [Bradymonadaceae bacterium]|nr:heavy metal translocating P-type ATPase [Lujinxingiaceae bacterium]
MKSEAAPTSCVHCGLPSGEAQFCCVGCEAVYHAIHDSGLEGFYRLRDVASRGPSPVGSDGQPAPASRYAHLDTLEFLQRHAVVEEGGVFGVELYLEGIHCAGCVWLIERMPRFLDGVIEARLDLARARLSVRFRPDVSPLSSVALWLSRFGYTTYAVRAERVAARAQAERAMLVRVGVCWALAANVMLLAIALYAGLDLLDGDGLASAARWLSFALCTISMVYGGGVFFRRAWASLRVVLNERSALSLQQISMDVPIALGIFVGYVHSAAATVTGAGEVWFDSLAVLIAAVLTARWLQVRGRRAAGDAAERLLSLLPSVARRLRGALSEEIPSESLEPGDLIEVRAGEVVAADGQIVEGRSSVFRAVLTGESRPEPVAPGEAIEAGVTNLGSRIVVRVAAAGSQTRVGKLLRWVEEHGERRAPIVQLADRLGGVFVLVVLAASLVTALVWSMVDPDQAVSHVVALLVISCPCALGMATPLALTVGVGQAARRGIYVKHDDVMQSLARATHVIFDKTGTLTEGRMTVAEISGSERAVRLAAILEAGSNHPIAVALRSQPADLTGSPSCTEFVEQPGAGVFGKVDGKDVIVGHLAWVQAKIASVPDPDDQALVERMAGDGLTPVVVAVDGRIEAIVGLGDRLRPEAVELIAALKRRGLVAALLSGDHEGVVDAIAARLGLEAQFVRGGATPEQKARFVEALRAELPQATIVMVGDGVNDAVALQAAHVGIAVHGGSEAALVAADIFMTREGVEPILELIEGAGRVMGVVHRNLAGSALYNALGITFAVLGYVAPLVAAVAMPVSSLAVVISSLVQTSFVRRNNGFSEPARNRRESKECTR